MRFRYNYCHCVGPHLLESSDIRMLSRMRWHEAVIYKMLLWWTEHLTHSSNISGITTTLGFVFNSQLVISANQFNISLNNITQVNMLFTSQLVCTVED